MRNCKRAANRNRARAISHTLSSIQITALLRGPGDAKRDRLTERGAKVAVVGQEVSYESEAAFSRAFKKFSGRTPREWRSS